MEKPVAMKCERPQNIPPRTMLDIMLEVTGLALLIIVIGAVYRYWPRLPEMIPTHFNLVGAPDSWAGKSKLLVLPVIAAAMYVLFTVIGFFPQFLNYPVTVTVENSSRLYSIARRLLACMKVELLLLFLSLIWGTIRVAVHNTSTIPAWHLPVFLLLIFGTVITAIIAMYNAR